MANHTDNRRYTQVKDIAPANNIPTAFLAKILQNLARYGLLESSKGRGGGFRLARDPHELTLAEVVKAVDGLDRFRQCVIGPQPCSDEHPCPQHHCFREIRQQIIRFLETSTIAQAAQGATDPAQLNGLIAVAH